MCSDQKERWTFHQENRQILWVQEATFFNLNLKERGNKISIQLRYSIPKSSTKQAVATSAAFVPGNIFSLTLCLGPGSYGAQVGFENISKTMD